MISMFTEHCNFVRVHQTLRATQAMEGGQTRKFHDMEWIVGLMGA